MASVNADELENAMILVDEPGSGDAWICPRTGAVYVRSDLVGELEPLPDDIDDPDKYIAVPGLRSLDLGQALVLDFVRQYMAADEDTVRHAFRRAGAYRRFSKLVEERGLRERWHAFRDTRTAAAMRSWCEEQGLELSA